MCEFTVRKKGEVVFKGAVHAKSDGSKVTVRDILGVSETFENYTIEDVKVRSEHLYCKQPRSSCSEKPCLDSEMSLF